MALPDTAPLRLVPEPEEREEYRVQLASWNQVKATQDGVVWHNSWERGELCIAPCWCFSSKYLALPWKVSFGSVDVVVMHHPAPDQCNKMTTCIA